MKKFIIHFVLLSFWLLLAATGCEKALFDTHIKGRVVSYGSGNGIAGATVGVIATSSNSFSIGNSHTVTSTTTNNNGEFELTYRKEKEYTYSLKAKKERYFEDELPIESKKITFYLTPEAYIQLHIKNTQPVNDQDKFDMNISFDCKGNSIHPLVGMNIDTTICVIARGNSVNAIPIFIYKNWNSVSRVEKIYSIAFDTTYFDINY